MAARTDGLLRARGGYFIAEALVSLGLSLLVAAAMSATLLGQARLARTVGERLAQNDATRTTLHILPAELRLLQPTQDLRMTAGDSIAGRWMRSSGVICAASATAIWVRLIGMRLPNEDKDSMIVVDRTGERVVSLDQAVADPASCPPAGGNVYRVPDARAGEMGGAVLVFESGTYYLSQRALRYRLGTEGRQPLTHELLHDGGSGLDLETPQASPAKVRVLLQLKQGFHQNAMRTATAEVILPNAGLQ